jgi:hypothetical protein
MNKKALLRIALDILLAVSVANGWWFVAAPLGAIGALAFPYFSELVIAGVAYDSLFGFIPGMGLGQYAGTIVSVVLLISATLFRKVVRK